MWTVCLLHLTGLRPTFSLGRTSPQNGLNLMQNKPMDIHFCSWERCARLLNELWLSSAFSAWLGRHSCFAIFSHIICQTHYISLIFSILGSNDWINGRLFADPLNELLDVFLLFLISEGIFEDSRGCQFVDQHPILANISDNHEATEHFVWNSTFGP